jgi:hypothetical protein
VETIGELLVLARKADEAGEELDWLVQQRGQVVDQVIRQADTAQEHQGQRTRALQGLGVDAAWSRMSATVQPLPSERSVFPNTVSDRFASLRFAPLKFVLTKIAPSKPRPVWKS